MEAAKFPNFKWGRNGYERAIENNVSAARRKVALIRVLVFLLYFSCSHAVHPGIGALRLDA